MSALPGEDERPLDATGDTPETDAHRAAEESALLRLAQRDLRAFETIYRRYYRPIHRYCYRRLAQREAADDATAQTFARAMAGVGGYGSGSVAAWLFTIARHVVIDAVRYRRPHDDIDALPGLAGRERPPDEQAIGADQRRALFAALGRLTTDQRTIVELRLAGLTGVEIAAALGMTPGAQRAAQFRAYARLRVLLAPEDIFGEGTDRP